MCNATKPRPQCVSAIIQALASSISRLHVPSMYLPWKPLHSSFQVFLLHPYHDSSFPPWHLGSARTSKTSSATLRAAVLGGGTGPATPARRDPVGAIPTWDPPDRLSRVPRELLALGRGSLHADEGDVNSRQSHELLKGDGSSEDGEGRVHNHQDTVGHFLLIKEARTLCRGWY